MSVTVREPTLDDVFVKLTGRQIREEKADRLDSVKARVRRRRMSGRPGH